MNPASLLERLCASLIVVEWGKEREGISWETTTETFKNLGKNDEGMVHDLRTFGSAALNLYTFASGAMDLCWSGGWDARDVCAGRAILLEAGRRMVNGNPSETMAEPAVDGKKYLAGTIPPARLHLLCCGASRCANACSMCVTVRGGSNRQHDLIREF